MSKTKFCTYDAIYGFVDYGEVEVDSNRIEWMTKERCKCCGGAWIAENYLAGHWKCPFCGAEDNQILHVK